MASFILGIVQSAKRVMNHRVSLSCKEFTIRVRFLKLDCTLKSPEELSEYFDAQNACTPY